MESGNNDLEKRRIEFGARTQKEARNTAYGIASRLIDAYLSEGQPGSDAIDKDIPEKDIKTPY